MRIIAGILFACLFISSCQTKQALQLHPANPHVFLFRNQPTLLLGSTEHYGAVANLDFDYNKYLEKLKSDGLNLTRLFSGIYVEHPGAFNIENNTLAPKPDRFICMYARSNEPGYANGGNKFDLNMWDEAYFKRLKDFMKKASECGVVVEFDLFSSIYGNEQWTLCPMNPKNNINKLDTIAWQELLSLKHPDYVAHQEIMIRKIVTELNEFDNLYYEICNEPYITKIEQNWQDFVVKTIVATEEHLPVKHLISQNIENGYKKVESFNPNVSILNFHYSNPKTVTDNYHLNVAIGDNETGFNGNADEPYRLEMWAFLAAGGTLYNHLDYSFCAGYEDGTFKYPSTQPGGGSQSLRNQISFAGKYLNNFDLLATKPVQSLVDSVVPASYNALALEHSTNNAFTVYTYRASGNTDADFSVRWNGFIVAPQNGTYTIYTNSDDGVRLFVDNKKVIENWTNHGQVYDSVEINLKKGQIVPVTLEFYQGLGGLTCQLLWKFGVNQRVVIASNNYLQPDKKTKGLAYELFRGIDLTNKVKSGTIDKIDITTATMSEAYRTATSQSNTKLYLSLPQATYLVEIINPVDGKVLSSKKIDHKGGNLMLDFETAIVDRLVSLKKN